jgi:hypothetical protein
MKHLVVAAVLAALVAAPMVVFALAPAPDAGSRAIAHKTYNGYAESRDSGLKGDASFLAITSQSEFSRFFDPVLTPRGAPDPVGRGDFDTRLFVAVIKRSDVLWDYKVEKVSANGDTLTVHYTATARGGTKKPADTGQERPRDTRGPAATPKPRDSAAERPAGPSASFDSPLILSVPKDRYLTVVLVENGRKAGTARVGD